MLFDPSMPAIPRIQTRQWSAELMFTIVASSSGRRAMLSISRRGREEATWEARTGPRNPLKFERNNSISHRFENLAATIFFPLCVKLRLFFPQDSENSHVESREAPPEARSRRRKRQRSDGLEKYASRLGPGAYFSKIDAPTTGGSTDSRGRQTLQIPGCGEHVHATAATA